MSPEDQAIQQGTQPNAEERIQHRDAYHMIPPNEKKRKKNAMIAKKEEQQYKNYKDGQKLGHISYVGTVGGGAGLPAARRQSQTQHRHAVTTKKIASQRDWKDDRKRMDTVANEEHKAAQRMKAERNTERDSARHRRLDGDRRRANEAFLARYEKETQEKKTAKVLSKSAAQDFNTN